MKNLSRFSVLFGSILALGACGKDKLHSPSNLLQDTRLQVEEKKFSETISLSQVDDSYIHGLSHHYVRHGGSPMELIVTYDPKSYRNTAMTAGTKAGDLSESLRKRGVLDINSSILPVMGQGDDSHLIISYLAHHANAPKGCDRMMPGLNEDEVRDDLDYKMGCSIGALVSKQVSRPSDLFGRGNLDTVTDGRASSNIIEAYRTGARNEPLEGEQASESE